MTGQGPTFVHATALVVGDVGLLIRGASGCGKTSLALALIVDATRDGRFARLVGDDRIGLTGAGGRLLARPHPSIAGRVEVRGLGVLPIEHEPGCVVRLVADLVSNPSELGPRCPEHAPTATLLGVDCPALTLLATDGARDNAARVLTVMGALRRKQGGTGPICLPTRLQCTT